MLPRLVRLAYVLGVIVPVVLAVQVFMVFDEGEGAGALFQVVVQDLEQQVSAEDLTGTLQEVATDRQADVGFVVVDMTDPTRTKHIYAVAGTPGGVVADRLADGYRHFAPYIEEHYRAFGEVGDLDPRGYYLVWGDRADADAVLTALGEHGLSGEVYPYAGHVGALLTDPQLFVNGHRLTAAAVALLALVVMVGGGVVMSAQAYGVQRLQGRSFGAVFRRDLHEVVVVLAGTVAVAAPVAVVALWFYDRWARAGELAAVVLGVACLFLVVALLTHLAAIGMSFRVPILAAVKGHFSADWALVGVFAIRVAGVFLAASVAFATLETALQVADRAAAQERWNTDPHAVYVQLSGQMGGDDPELEAAFGSMAREAVERGDAVLVDDISRQLTLTERLPGGRAQGRSTADACPVLLVNEAYLERQAVTGASGERVTSVPDGAVTALAPPACLSFAQDVIPGFVGGPARSAQETPGGAGEVSYQELAAAQSHFTYGTMNDLQDAALVRDAVLVVVPPGAQVFPDGFYGAFLTQGNIVFPDAATAQRYVDEFEVGSIVNGIWSAEQHAAGQYAEVVASFRLMLLSLLVALFILVVTAVSVSAIHVRRSAQLVYVHHITGWPWWRAHRWVLAVETALAAVAIGVGVNGALATTHETVRFEAAVLAGNGPALRVAVAVAVVLLAFGAVLVGLRRATSRLVSTRSADS